VFTSLPLENVMNDRTLTLLAAALLAPVPCAQSIEGPSYPAKAIRLIVPTVPGSPPDVVGRLVGERLSGALGQPVVVDNRPGAIGTIGLHAVTRATPDGYTIGVISMPYVIAPSLLAQVSYDTVRDLAPVTLVNWSYTLLAVPAASPARSVADLVTLAKRRPGLLKFSSNGNATPSHLMAELFQREAGVRMIHIPYKGSVAGVSAVLSGEVDMTIGAAVSVTPHVTAGKLRALATAAPKRLVTFPDVPTLLELGYPNLQVSDWQGIVAPAATAAKIVERLHAEIEKALRAPEVRQRLETLGMEVAGAGPKEFGPHIQREVRRWSKLVRDVGITAE
jgi:tripartite-type tricarboxylate transporter receptor subunit TctC